MSFESYRLNGRLSTLLMLLLPIVAGISIAFMSLFGLSTRPNPYITIIFIIPNFVGYILFLVAMNGFAKYYDEPKIFKNSLYVLLVSITGGIASLVLSYIFITPILDQLTSYLPSPGNFPTITIISSFLQVLVFILATMSVMGILNGFFYRRAFYALAEKSGEKNFKQAGLFMFIGGFLMIILVGSLLFFIGLIFATIGFFSMKPKSSQTNSIQ